MRLSPAQIRSIKQVTADVLGAHARIMLFGSRTDDTRRGGDIDLFVPIPAVPQALQIEVKLKMLVKLKQQLGDQRIDLILAPAPGQPVLPIHSIAQQTGILL